MLRPMPERIVVMAVYPEGNLNPELVKRYQAVLARHAIDLQLAPSAGAVDSSHEGPEIRGKHRPCPRRHHH